jgi:hypothetical protein
MPDRVIRPPARRPNGRPLGVALLRLWRAQYREILRLARWGVHVRLGHWDERLARLLMPHALRYFSHGYSSVNVPDDLSKNVLGNIAGAIRQGFDSAVAAVREFVARLANALNEVTARRANLVIGNAPPGQADPAALHSAVVDPKRAARIADNEAFRITVYGEYSAVRDESGPESYKVWEAQPGCCRVCAGLDGQRQPVDAPFTYREVRIYHPPAHASCKCQVRFHV